MVISADQQLDLTKQEERACLYAFFARLVNDQTRLADLTAYRAHLAHVTGEYTRVTERALKAIEDWSSTPEADQEIRTEYARLFIMPGGVQPVESVYLSEKPLLMGEPWQKVKQFYKQSGLVLEQPALHPEDHAAVELSFMAYLVENGADINEQKHFFAEHISRWFYLLFDKIANHKAALFYKEMAACGALFIEMEESYLAEVSVKASEEPEQRSEL